MAGKLMKLLWAGSAQVGVGLLRGKNVPATATPTGDASEEKCGTISRFMVGKGSCVHSNLGGHGPDAGQESLVFGDVFPFSTEQIDMKITAVDGEYEPYNVSHNGERGFFMSINVKCGTTAILDLELVDAKTGESRPAPYEWMFSIFDFDSETDGVAGIESVDIRGFDEVIRTNTSTVKEEIDGIFTKFTASRAGEIEDNPKAPWNLTDFQKDDMVTLLYAPRFSLRMKLSATDCETGRNFEFSGTTGLGCPWKETCDNYVCPDEMVDRADDKNGGSASLFCKHETCGDIDTDTCCVTTTTTTTTDGCNPDNTLTLTNVKSANLGGLGPDTDKEDAIIFTDVLPMLDHKVDLAVMVVRDSSYAAGNLSRNGLVGEMYDLNMMMGTESRFKFEFRHTNSNAPVQVPPFYFTIADIDEREGGGGKESVKVSDWEKFTLSPESNVVFDHETKTFTSSSAGELVDNPDTDSHPMHFRKERKKKSVSFTMPALYNFFLDMSVSEREPCDDCHDQDTGRNIFFAGASRLVCNSE